MHGTLNIKLNKFSYMTILIVFQNWDRVCLLRVTPPPDGATARGGPWPPLQCASRPLDSLLFLSIHLTFRLLMSYIYGAPILDVSRSHTTTQHSR